MSASPDTVIFLFTDIEGSTRLWEQQTDRMRDALAAHDRVARAAVQGHRGRLVKTTGDGIHAVFADAADAVQAVRQLLAALADPAATAGLPLAVRCGLHAGAEQARDNDYFGPAVNRAARIMAAAHGGQALLSQVVVDALAGRLPPGMALRELGPVRLRDLQRPERLWQLLAPPLRADFPALRSLEATPNNLAQQLNRFIGREAALPELRALLAQHRLVTLYGTGGIGKSRLAMQLGAELMDAFPDGVWFIELAPVTDAAGALQAVASVLGLKEAPGQPLAEALEAFVRERRLLLVLDNCEHLLAAAAALAKRLLRAGAGLRLLATSREVLRIAGEASWPVPALSAPDPAAPASADAVMQHAAVRLFADRAGAAQPGFQVVEANAAAVAEICHRLDGIPLAIELAAARIRTLPAAVMARRLLDSFRLVTTSDETVAPRQRTLHRLIDWSHDLLQPAEQQLFCRLSVFAGGWTLEAAEDVCADDATGRDEVADRLSQLVEKSLVVLDADSGRYRLLETVRLYAAEKRVSAAGDPTAARHLQWALALAEQAAGQLAGAQQAFWLSRLDAERANLLAAHAQALASPGSAGLALRLSFALRDYWLNRGLLTLGQATLLAALEHAELKARDGRRARGLFDAGHLCNVLGQHDRACQVLEESVSIIRELGEEARLAVVLQPLGVAYAGQGDMERARACLETAVAVARGIDRPEQLASALVVLGHWHQRRQSADLAEPLYREALVLARRVDDATAVATILCNLAMLALAQGRPEDSLALVADALAVARRSGSVMLVIGVLDVGVALAVSLQQPTWARRLHLAAQALCERTGYHREPADDDFLRPWLARLGPLPSAAMEAPAASGRSDDEALDTLLGELAAWLAGLGAASPSAGQVTTG